MAYIGNTPAENYASFLTETFTVSATANYTLSHAVTNENEIRLVINGVVQQPGSGKAYTASGTTLTLTSATVSGDVMYAVYLGRALQTVNPPNASVGTAQISSSARTTNLLYPAFEAVMSSSQSISDDTLTKITFDSEQFDTNSAYDTSTYRFTVPNGSAGKYNVYLIADLKSGSNSNFEYGGLYLYKNGSQIRLNWIDTRSNNGREFTTVVQTSLDLSEGDYLEAYGYVQVASSTPTIENAKGSTSISVFGAYRIGA